MEIKVAAIIMAPNYANKVNPWIVLDYAIKNNSYRLPQLPLPEHGSSISIIREIFSKACGINTLNHFNVVQGGFFDDPSRTLFGREILLVYNVYLPDRIDLFGDYKWVTIDRLHKIDLELDTLDIIRDSVMRREV